MRHVHERPRDGEDPVAGFQPEHVEHIAADRLQHNAALKGPDDPRVLLRGDPQFREESRSGHCQRASGEVVEHRPKHDQADHPPAQAFDFRHDYFGGQLRPRRSRTCTAMLSYSLQICSRSIADAIRAQDGARREQQTKSVATNWRSTVSP
jgi:hypothetical protein